MFKFSFAFISITIFAFVSMVFPVYAETGTAMKYKQLSTTLVMAGNGKLALNSKEAIALFERALVANPANVQALSGLGRAYEANGETGKGLKYYRQALAIDPNDTQTLGLQGVAFLKREMLNRATANRDRLARLCQNGCGALDTLTTAIDQYISKTPIAAEGHGIKG